MRLRNHKGSNVSVSIDHLFADLARIPWVVASQTFGNDHATLIGLLVSWWVSGDPSSRWAVEGGPSYGYRKREQGGGGQCDALFCQDQVAVGVLEVEGTRPDYTAAKLGKFFAAEYDDLRSLEFAVLLLYAYQPTGLRENRHLPPALDAKTTKQVQAVSTRYPAKAIILITLEKLYERQASGIRARSEYYWGRPTDIGASLWVAGQRVREAQICTTSHNQPLEATAQKAGRA